MHTIVAGSYMDSGGCEVDHSAGAGVSDIENCVSSFSIETCDNDTHKDIEKSDVITDSHFQPFIYGYIPHTFNTAIDSPARYINGKGFSWLCATREDIARTGQANYVQARIRVPSKFNFSIWFKHLEKYWDTRILDYLQFGFPICQTDDFAPHCSTYNHVSAINFSKHVQEYMDTEIAEGAIIGPFDDKHFESFHTSPMLSR